MAAPLAAIGLQAFSMGLDIASGFRKVQEFKKQAEGQKRLLDEHTRMVNLQREAMIADTERRAQIVEGTIVARAGAAGVAADSKSVINAAVDVVKRAAIDKARINNNANSQVYQNTLKKIELDRQGRAAQRQAVWDTVAGLAGKAGGALGNAGGSLAGPGFGAATPGPSGSLTTMADGATSQTGAFYSEGE